MCRKSQAKNWIDFPSQTQVVIVLLNSALDLCGDPGAFLLHLRARPNREEAHPLLLAHALRGVLHRGRLRG